MTCEVAVLNKLGIAVATDSAVTVGRNHKVYHSAQKLFQLSATEPVAIATYGAASILGVPWELLIKSYRTRLGTHRFDYLEQYRDDFLRYLESANPLFGEEQQERDFEISVTQLDLWRPGKHGRAVRGEGGETL